MIEKKELELIDDSSFNSFINNYFVIQDKTKGEIDNQNKFNNNITKVEKDFILKKNEIFFAEYKNLYSENIILKNKLNEIVNEKKRLNLLIIKLEQQMDLSKKKNDEKSDNCSNNGNMKIIEPYRKIKRKRRRKCEIKTIYKCTVYNCNKSYPTKGSLNMHIKLKHQKDKFYSLENESKI